MSMEPRPSPRAMAIKGKSPNKPPGTKPPPPPAPPRTYDEERARVIAQFEKILTELRTCVDLLRGESGG